MARIEVTAPDVEAGNQRFIVDALSAQLGMAVFDAQIRFLIGLRADGTPLLGVSLSAQDIGVGNSTPIVKQVSTGGL